VPPSTHVGCKIYTFVINMDYKLFYHQQECSTKQVKIVTCTVKYS